MPHSLFDPPRPLYGERFRRFVAGSVALRLLASQGKGEEPAAAALCDALDALRLKMTPVESSAASGLLVDLMESARWEPPRAVEEAARGARPRPMARGGQGGVRRGACGFAGSAAPLPARAVVAARTAAPACTGVA